MNSPTDTLKARLAAGEITVEEYKELLGIVASDSKQSPGALLAEAGDVKLHENCIVSRGREYALSDVTSVLSSNSSMSFNFVPIEKSTSVTISFLSGEHISLSEDRTYLAGAKHKAIARLSALVRHATFQSRLNNLAARLAQSARLLIYTPYLGDGEEVYLTRDGFIETSNKRISVKSAKANGFFGVGMEWQSLGFSRAYNTETVAINETKGKLGFIPKNALQFTVNTEDTDIANALLLWLAEPNNHLVPT